MPASHGSADDDVLLVVRTFSAPRALAWKVWTQAEHLGRWWGPKGYTMGVMRLDLRAGGVFQYSMKSPAGVEMWGRFDYLGVDAPSRLSFINGFSDKDGNFTRHPLSPTWPLKVMNELTMTEQGGRTTITLRAQPFEATAEEIATFSGHKQNVQQGFKGTLDNLEKYLRKAQAQAQGDNGS